MHKLSIITINYNNAKGLQKTIDSVINQTYTDFEYIVIDAASTDGSKELIEQYSNQITYWISEPDTGIYNGMNKGIKQAKGEYCLFLNSGDFFKDNSVLKASASSLQTHYDLIYGDLILNYAQPKKVTYPKQLDYAFFYEGALPHPSLFIKKEIFEQYGYYREDLKIVSDWEHYVRLFVKHNVTYLHLDIIIAVFDVTGVTFNPKHHNKNLNERKKVLLELFDETTLLLMEELSEKRKELRKYESSRLIQWLKKIQESKLYNTLMNS